MLGIFHIITIITSLQAVIYRQYQTWPESQTWLCLNWHLGRIVPNLTLQMVKEWPKPFKQVHGWIGIKQWSSLCARARAFKQVHGWIGKNQLLSLCVCVRARSDQPNQTVQPMVVLKTRIMSVWLEKNKTIVQGNIGKRRNVWILQSGNTLEASPTDSKAHQIKILEDMQGSVATANCTIAKLESHPELRFWSNSSLWLR